MVFVVTKLREVAAKIAHVDEVRAGVVSESNGASEGICDLHKATVDIVAKVDRTAHGVGNHRQTCAVVGEGDGVAVFIRD